MLLTLVDLFSIFIPGILYHSQQNRRFPLAMDSDVRDDFNCQN
jgi:hypothetical protein